MNVRPVAPAPAAPTAAAAPVTLRPVTTGVQTRPKRLLIYGPGGVGKSQLASLVPGALVLDLEGGTAHLDVARVDLRGATLPTIRAHLHAADLWSPYRAVVLDTATALEEQVVAHTLATVPVGQNGGAATTVESYGYGKGYQHVYDQFLPVLGDLDRIVESGRHVVVIAHECVADAPNPAGDDFQRYEPRLQGPKSGRASIRDRVFEWADVVGYLSFDVVARDGKGRGSGTRTVYFDARPTWRAKGRGTFPKVIPFNDPTNATEILKCLN